MQLFLQKKGTYTLYLADAPTFVLQYIHQNENSGTRIKADALRTISLEYGFSDCPTQQFPHLDRWKTANGKRCCNSENDIAGVIGLMFCSGSNTADQSWPKLGPYLVRSVGRHLTLWQPRSAVNMANASKTLTVFGASGFIGRQLIRSLSREPYANKLTLRVAARSAAVQSPSTWKRMGPAIGNIQPFPCDITNPHQVERAIEGATDVINCVGILYETPSRNITFARIQEEAPRVIAEAIKNSPTVKNMVHVSAIGADVNSTSAYARTKAKGELASLSLSKDFARVTILRPSIVFGPEDSFFNRFENMSRYLPFLPLVGGGKTKYQPVHVEDVAAAIIKALAIDSEMKTTSGIYEVGGKTVLTFEQLMQMMLEVTGRKRLLLPIPFAVASMQGAFFESIHSRVPSLAPLLTRDQVELLKSDNIVSPSAKTLYDLGIEPKGCSAHTIQYIG
ncbi:unnamed protein product [Agarophyton chilense]